MDRKTPLLLSSRLKWYAYQYMFRKNVVEKLFHHIFMVERFSSNRELVVTIRHLL